MKLDKLSGVRVMSVIASEMRSSIIVLAGERQWSETRTRWLERAARAAGISFRSAKSFFYGEDHEPRASTVERVRRAVAAQTNEAALADRYTELVQRIATLEAALLQDQERDGLGASVDRR